MFENDGCTMFFNGWGGLSWQTCCDVHDEAFATGTSVQEFLIANYELWRCIAVQDIFAATIAVVGVMTGGAAFFFFGRKRKRQ
jgi:ABC-type iron transport system FetAB permease component